MKYVYLFIVGLVFMNCKQKDHESLSAQKIIDNSIDVMGGPRLDSSIIEFNFREKHYTALRSNGIFKYSREFVDSSSGEVVVIKDELNNDGFSRMTTDSVLEVPDSMAIKYAASVNSVHYFSVLPYGLNADAVIKTRKSDITIKDQEYYCIQITFREEGGGEDFEDIFLYWINKADFALEYLAYSYNEADGKGMRFREAYNPRLIDGVRFLDYYNYKPKSKQAGLDELPKLFQSGDLELLSKIELKEIKVY